jgi:hypothetical protein
MGVVAGKGREEICQQAARVSKPGPPVKQASLRMAPVGEKGAAGGAAPVVHAARSKAASARSKARSSSACFLTALASSASTAARWRRVKR